jgi:transposase
MKTRRNFTREFKLSVLRELESGKNVAQLSRENNLYPSLIGRWKKELQNDPENAFQGNGNTYKDIARIAELEKLVGRLYAENSLLKKALTNLELHLQEQRKKSTRR